MTPLPQLKLFVPDAPSSLFPPGPDDPRVSADSTLPQYYELHFRPVRQAFASPATIKEYRQNLREWKRLTGDPSLRRIDLPVCSKFLTDLHASGLTLATVDKYRRQLQAILTSTGPVTPRKDDQLNAGLLASPPWFPEVPVPKRLKEKPRPTLDQVRAIWRACEQMTEPRVHGVAPALWWRTLLATYYELAFRRAEAIDLRFDWLERRGDVTLLIVDPEARKGSLRGIVKQLSPSLAGLYEQLRTNDRELIFAYPRSLRNLSGQYNRLLAKAGVPTGKNLAFHSLRRLHSDFLDVETGKLSLGHSTDLMLRKHYKAAETVAAQVAEKIPPLWQDVADAG